MFGVAARWAGNGLMTLLVLGIGYGLYLYFNGNPANFMATVANVIGATMSVIGHIVAGLLGALHVPKNG